MKRILDLAIIVLLAPVWLPVAAIVALAVRVNLGRPVLFAQDRAGLNGRPFTLYKFRTMRTGEGSDAERLTTSQMSSVAVRRWAHRNFAADASPDTTRNGSGSKEPDFASAAST